jgi:uncharacterized membrane protein YsdA (DUF1294 family)
MLWWLLAGLTLVMSTATFVAYGLDKRAAVRGARRTRERTLLLMGLSFGWPGAIAAQQLFRHKTKDRVFLVWFWATVAVHAAGWTWYAARLIGG